MIIFLGGDFICRLFVFVTCDDWCSSSSLKCVKTCQSLIFVFTTNYDKSCLSNSDIIIMVISVSCERPDVYPQWSFDGVKNIPPFIVTIKMQNIYLLFQPKTAR